MNYYFFDFFFLNINIRIKKIFYSFGPLDLDSKCHNKKQFYFYFLYYLIITLRILKMGFVIIRVERCGGPSSPPSLLILAFLILFFFKVFIIIESFYFYFKCAFESNLFLCGRGRVRSSRSCSSYTATFSLLYNN